MRKSVFAVTTAIALAAGAAQAALLDLASRNLEQGALLYSTDMAVAFFDGPNDFFQVSEDLPAPNFIIDGFPSEPASPFLLENSTGFQGSVIDFEFDLAAGMAEGLFSDGSGAFALAKVSFPAGALTQLPGPSDDFEQGGLGVEIFDVTIIPLPAALPLALAGFGGLVLVGRSRRGA